MVGLTWKYRKQVSFGTDGSGNRIRKWFHADTKADLNRQILEYQMEIEKCPNPSDMTFREYSEQWFETYKSHLAAQSQSVIRTSMKKCAFLEPFPVRKITRSMCQKIVNQSWEHPHSAKGVADVLRQIFRAAVADGIIASNPAADLTRPKASPPKFHLLTDKELEAVRNAKLSEQDRLFVTILQTFGLRPGEALALLPKDFDLSNKILHISKSLEMPANGGCRIKTTKTGVTRDIPIPDALIPYLRKSLSGNKTFILFQKKTGGYYTKSAYKRLSERIWKAVNIELGGSEYLSMVSELSLYDFRHRRATDLYYLCQQGIISTKQAAALMGHSEIIFLKTYSHIDDSKENLDAIYPHLCVTNL